MATNACSDVHPAPDPAERVAAVVRDKRDRLLAVHRFRLSPEELEDCFAQATLELVVRARRTPFESDLHAANALEQKFRSRVTDRIRAVHGRRSPVMMAMRNAAALDDPDAENDSQVPADLTVRLEAQALARHDLRALRELACELTDDQRLVLACQVVAGMECAEFCERYGWSAEKFRKVAQRARDKLRSLLKAYDQGERCRELEPALMSVAARVAEPDQAAQVDVHTSNCRGCARTLRDLRAAERGVAALLPLPVTATAGIGAKLVAAAVSLRRILHLAPSADPGGGGAVTAGGSALSIGAAKAGVAALCIAGAAGGYSVCSHIGMPPAADAKVGHPEARHHAAPAPVRAAGTMAAVPTGRVIARVTPQPPTENKPAPSRPSGGQETVTPEFAGDSSTSGAEEFASATAAAVPVAPQASQRSAEGSQEFSGEFDG